MSSKEFGAKFPFFLPGTWQGVFITFQSPGCQVQTWFPKADDFKNSITYAYDPTMLACHVDVSQAT